MKNIKINLAVVAVILGTSMAMASVKPFEEAVYYNDAPSNQPTNWVLIPEGKTVSCNEEPFVDCTANSSQQPIEDGEATLIDL